MHISWNFAITGGKWKSKCPAIQCRCRALPDVEDVGVFLKCTISLIFFAIHVQESHGQEMWKKLSDTKNQPILVCDQQEQNEI